MQENVTRGIENKIKKEENNKTKQNKKLTSTC
jgi:hypothetical protein